MSKNPLAATTPQLSDAVVIVVPSHSEANKTYTVTFPVNGQPTCTCKGYGYRGHCSHIKEAADKLLDKLIERGLLTTTLEINPEHMSKHDQITQGLATMHCTREGCNEPLTGTHAFLDKCAACYRHDTLTTTTTTTTTTNRAS